MPADIPDDYCSGPPPPEQIWDVFCEGPGIISDAAKWAGDRLAWWAVLAKGSPQAPVNMAMPGRRTCGGVAVVFQHPGRLGWHGLLISPALLFSDHPAASDVFKAVPELCCSDMADHQIETSYITLLEAACLQPCDELQLCLCGTSFLQEPESDYSAEAVLPDAVAAEPTDTTGTTAASDAAATDTQGSLDTTGVDPTGTIDAAGLSGSTDTTDTTATADTQG